jgi:hypothetical protein
MIMLNLFVYVSVFLVCHLLVSCYVNKIRSICDILVLYNPVFIAFWVDISSTILGIYILSGRNSANNPYIFSMITILVFLFVVIPPISVNIFACFSALHFSVYISFIMRIFHCFPIKWTTTLGGIVTFLVVISSSLSWVNLRYTSKVRAVVQFIFVASTLHVVHSYSSVRYILSGWVVSTCSSCPLDWELTLKPLLWLFQHTVVFPAFSPLTPLDQCHIIRIVFD